MTLDEKISQLEKKLAELSSPPIAIEHTAVEIGTGICEKHGSLSSVTVTRLGQLSLPQDLANARNA